MGSNELALYFGFKDEVYMDDNIFFNNTNIPCEEKERYFDFYEDDKDKDLQIRIYMGCYTNINEEQAQEFIDSGEIPSGKKGESYSAKLMKMENSVVRITNSEMNNPIKYFDLEESILTIQYCYNITRF